MRLQPQFCEKDASLKFEFNNFEFTTTHYLYRYESN